MDRSLGLLSSFSIAVIDHAAGFGFLYLHCMQTIAICLKRFFQAVEKEHGYMFGRWVDCLEGLMLIEIAVVQLIDHGVDDFFQLFEIDPHTEMIELTRPDSHFDLPIVAVGIFAIPRIGTEVVSPGKMGCYIDIHLNSCWLPDLLVGLEWNDAATKAACTLSRYHGKYTV
jgi:hypothetical protein